MAVRTVFLSSTWHDLKDHRAKVIDALQGLDGWNVVDMEHFGARDAEPDEFCRGMAKECDVFVGIIGHCYGSIHEGSGKSYTEREYDAALEVKKPRLIFLAPKDFPLPADLIEDDEKRKKQKAFQQRATQSRIRDTFTSPDDLARRVVSALQNLARQGPGERGDEPLSLRPLPPQPNFVHPYPLQPNFTGRVSERRMLTEWLTGGNQPVMALLAIADRCEYRLNQADIHNFLARLDLDAGDLASARTHAQTAQERAHCDGPPHCYQPALDEAERLLAELDGQQ